MAVKGVKRTVLKRKAVSSSRAKAATAKKALPKGARKTANAKTPDAMKGIPGVAINLAKREDRWKKIQSSVAKQAPWLPLTRLDAVDGRSAPPPTKDVSLKWSTANLATLFHWYKAVTVKMSPGERGCCGSHIKAWRQAAKMTTPLLVLEDDAVCLPSFTTSLATAVREAPKDTGMIFVSSKDRGYPKKVGKVLMKPDFVWTTVGYLIWPAAARTWLKMLPMDMPVDNFLAWHIKQGKIKAFSIRPAAVRQAATWNVGSDIHHSDDVAH